MNFRNLEIMEFATEDLASAWMEYEVDDGCMDNYRFAYDDDEEALGVYHDRAESGCCGSFDARVTIAGRSAVIGCNYGH